MRKWKVLIFTKFPSFLFPVIHPFLFCIISLSHFKSPLNRAVPSQPLVDWVVTKAGFWLGTSGVWLVTSDVWLVITRPGWGQGLLCDLEVWWFWFFEMVPHCTSPVVQKSILIFNTRFSRARLYSSKLSYSAVVNNISSCIICRTQEGPAYTRL